MSYLLCGNIFFNTQKLVFRSKYMSLTLNEEILLYNNDIYFYINEKIEVIIAIKDFSIVEIKINKICKKIYVNKNQIKEYINNSYYITPIIYKRKVI